MPLTGDDVTQKREKLAKAREDYQAKLPQLKKYMKAADEATERRAFLTAYHIETKGSTFTKDEFQAI